MRRGGTVGRYTLWCLNRIAGWDRDRLVRALAVRGLWSAKHDVVLGSRARFDQHPHWEETHGRGVLMHEDPPACDEYFVPIAVKCIGDPKGFLRRLGGRMSSAGRERFDALLVDFAKYFALVDHRGEPGWRRYWQPFDVGNALFKVGMFTRTDARADDPPDEPPLYAGLYEIVASEARAEKRRAVLAGYSQGGLVALFLAWMDEQLMEPAERAIAGVVTAHSPNHGSPLADTANANNVSAALLGILVGLGGYSIVGHADPRTRAAIEALVAGTAPPGAPVWHFGVGAVARILDAAIHDTPKSEPDRADFLRTARKWLTGLSADKTRTAFEDLDPVGLDDPGSILGRLVRTPLVATYHGATVGADTGLADLVLAGRSCLVRWLVHQFVARRWFHPVEAAYARIAMDEAAAEVPRGERHKQLAALYQTGVEAKSGPGIDIGPFKHDFVVPSVSQALYALAPPAKRDYFLGNKLNPRGTHASGADERDPDSDSPLVRRMLTDLGERLD
jgi:hypothetical protein